jgi:hypothetical protein
LTTAARIKANLIRRQAVVLGVFHVVVDFGRAQQRLGRDAAPVEADAAEMLALDNGGLHAELGGADGGDIAARSATDDDDVVSVCHGSPPVFCLPGGRRAAWSYPACAQHPVDFILELHPLLAHGLHVHVIGRLDIRFGAMNGPVHVMIGIEQLGEMRIVRFSRCIKSVCSGNSSASSWGTCDIRFLP